MRNALRLALLLAAAATVAGCAYYPVPPDPIRYVTSPADITTCRRLGNVGLARTDGVGEMDYSELTAILPNDGSYGRGYGLARGGYGGAEIPGPHFAVRLNTMRDAAVTLGATDLYLKKRIYRDYSYVEGLAYRCPR
ncbi:hypothetical protein [uncultured Enterovirga sp.]|uniref:hypothetical protein n=1 Tax=uncultured Enterovirga sp. TaxID=2026352 RepID=UPI0035CA162D